ncbi:hypothetical protein QBC37DRAFT_38819 [Rhypophila decipiens]|uniref:Uncharacterized protein n=1 Tax=Rhypophila decipiens TaxID=261697 RepID=A0AAN7BE32_9PEZI|nr:hypothetical protein QBC37DRAFT_38819 [Rhypophila decipiens]
MGLSSFNPLRSRDSKRPPKLPLYKEVPSSSHPSPTKERYSDVEYSSDDEDESDDGDSSDYDSSSSPGSSGSSRRTSGSSTLMLPKRKIAKANSSPSRRVLPRRHLYRLPNKVIRYLCATMMLAILAFIVTLVRASQLENKRIAEGTLKIEKKPTPPPWESFNFLTRYYGGIKTLVPFEDNVPQYPRLEDEGPYNFTITQSQEQKAGDGEATSSPATNKVPSSKAFHDHPGSALPTTEDGIHECFLDSQNKIRIPPIRYYDGRPMGFPNSVMGSYELLSLPEDICFDRFGRYGPYGYGYSAQTGGLSVGEHGDIEGAEDVWKSVKKVDWRKINWADAQRRCYKANAERYKPLESPRVPPQGFYIGESSEKASPKVQARDQAGAQQTQPVKSQGKSKAEEATEEPPKPPGDLSRTAIVVRCWDEFFWREEDVMNLRAIIAEMSLASGGRYDVHLLVQVRNDAKNPIWADDETYLNHIKDTVPDEFQDMVTLWSETQMLAVYQGVLDLWTKGPNLPVHGSYRGLQMAMQHFASKHPEYDYFWQWEMDIRYTGHYYDLLTKMETWAKDQPRKGIWERNARFYLPDVHGSWEDFKQMSRVQTEQGTLSPENVWDTAVPLINKKPSGSSSSSKKGEESIWGPKRPVDEKDWLSPESDPTPPTTYERDKYVWGVGEEADLITLNPIFNPEGTTWQLADDITGYNETAGNGGKPPRRAQIITASRMSRRLLLTMHRETAFKKHHAFPEMWPSTVALHHGYKAVFAPHPVYVDREWPTEYMARVMNGGKNGAAGGSRTAVFGDREHNLKGMTWFYNAGFSSNLYKRWLGLKVNNDGGEQFELAADNSKDRDDKTVSTMRGGEGRMCLPPMLLHPVKEVELPVEQIRAGEEGNLKEAGKEGNSDAEVISDPNA